MNPKVPLKTAENYIYESEEIVSPHPCRLRYPLFP